MEITKDSKVKIVGLGKVGMSIAQAFAQAGFTIQGMDVDQGNIDAGFKKVEENLDLLVSKGKIKTDEKDAILSRMGLSTDPDCIRDADVVIEAVFEDMDVKKETFGKIDEMVASKDALLLTNTSSLSVSEIASVTQRPEKVAGMHFFNPVPLMRLVEVIRGYATSDETVAITTDLAKKMGKTTVEVKKDSPGFIVNRIMIPHMVEAIKIVEEGIATKEDVDIAVKNGLTIRLKELGRGACES